MKGITIWLSLGFLFLCDYGAGETWYEVALCPEPTIPFRCLPVENYFLWIQCDSLDQIIYFKNTSVGDCNDSSVGNYQYQTPRIICFVSGGGEQISLGCQNGSPTYGITENPCELTYTKEDTFNVSTIVRGDTLFTWEFHCSPLYIVHYVNETFLSWMYTYANCPLYEWIDAYYWPFFIRTHCSVNSSTPTSPPTSPPTPTTTCNDQIMNGYEIGLDCGGPDCPPCEKCHMCDPQCASRFLGTWDWSPTSEGCCLNIESITISSVNPDSCSTYTTDATQCRPETMLPINFCSSDGEFTFTTDDIIVARFPKSAPVCQFYGLRRGSKKYMLPENCQETKPCIATLQTIGIPDPSIYFTEPIENNFLRKHLHLSTTRLLGPIYVYDGIKLVVPLGMTIAVPISISCSASCGGGDDETFEVTRLLPPIKWNAEMKIPLVEVSVCSLIDLFVDGVITEGCEWALINAIYARIALYGKAFLAGLRTADYIHKIQDRIRVTASDCLPYSPSSLLSSTNQSEENTLMIDFVPPNTSFTLPDLLERQLCESSTPSPCPTLLTLQTLSENISCCQLFSTLRHYQEVLVEVNISLEEMDRNISINIFNFFLSQRSENITLVGISRESNNNTKYSLLVDVTSVSFNSQLWNGIFDLNQTILNFSVTSILSDNFQISIAPNASEYCGNGILEPWESCDVLSPGCLHCTTQSGWVCSSSACNYSEACNKSSVAFCLESDQKVVFRPLPTSLSNGYTFRPTFGVVLTLMCASLLSQLLIRWKLYQSGVNVV